MNAGGKGFQDISTVRVQYFDKTAAVIAKKIFPNVLGWKLKDSRVVESRTGDRTTKTVVVGMEWVLIVGRRCLPTEVAFYSVPTIVAPGKDIIHFLKQGIADIVGEQPVRAGLHGGGKGVAEAIGPDGAVVVAEQVIERVVGGNTAVWIDAKDLTQGGVQVLRILAVGAIANGDVKFSISAELHGTAIVYSPSQLRKLKKHQFAFRQREVSIGRETADAIVILSLYGVKNVEIIVNFEARVQGDAA